MNSRVPGKENKTGSSLELRGIVKGLEEEAERDDMEKRRMRSYASLTAQMFPVKEENLEAASVSLTRLKSVKAGSGSVLFPTVISIT